MLSLDLWWHGENVCCDAGTYLYYAGSPWSNSLVRTRVHNTVTADDQDQMASGPRFMWFDWTKADLLNFTKSERGNLEIFQGQHYGYGRLRPPVTHRRAIVRGGDNLWLVIDDLMGTGAHDIACQWLLGSTHASFTEEKNELKWNLKDGPASLRWYAPDFVPTVSMSDEKDAPRGWRSRYYGLKEPALSFELASHLTLPCRIISLFSFGFAFERVELRDDTVTVGESFVAALAPLGSASSISKLSFTSPEGTEVLEIRP
jgi:hypothetical protein